MYPMSDLFCDKCKSYENFLPKADDKENKILTLQCMKCGNKQNLIYKELDSESMGQCIWFSKLIDGKKDQAGDHFDKVKILKHSKKLDSICRKIDIRGISDFFDFTELQAEMTDDYQGFKDGYSLAEAKATWFTPIEGTESIEKLINELKRNPVKIGLLSNSYDQVLNELENIVKQLETLDENEKFNLGIVM